MSTVACLVEVDGTDVKRKFEFHSEIGCIALSELRQAVVKCSIVGSVVEIANATFKLYANEFQCLVFLADADSVPHLSTVHVMPKAKGRRRYERSGTTVYITSTIALIISHFLLKELDHGSEATMEATPTACGTIVTQHRNDNRDGEGYVLPDFGSLHAAITSVAKGGGLTSSLQIKIVEQLYQSIVSITLYPTRGFYYKVVSMLVARYPCLRDVIGDGCSSWIVHLRNKFKHERRKLQDNEAVRESRAKVRNALKKKLQTNDICDMKRTKRNMEGTVTSYHEAPSSLQSHDEWLRKEVKKQAPDAAQVDARMDITCKERASDLAVMSFSECQEKYPYLMDSRLFFMDFERLTKREPIEAVQRWFRQLIDGTVNGTIPSSPSLLQSMQQIPHMKDRGSRQKKHLLAVTALRVLARCLGEGFGIAQLFVSENATVIPPTPCVVFTGDALEEAQHLHLSVEQMTIFRLTDAEEGLSAIFSSYWLFQAKYTPKAFRMTFIERYWFPLTYTAPRASVIRLINRMAKQST